METKNIIKTTIICLVATLAFVSCGVFSFMGKNGSVVGETKNYEYGEDFSPKSLTLEINAAEIRIEQGEKFLITSNLKYLEVTESEGSVVAKEQGNSSGRDSNGAFFTLCLPEGVSLDNLTVKIGAAAFHADSLSAGRVEINVGAGSLTVESLVATESAKIEGGAGKITVGAGSLKELEATIGAGELTLTFEIVGSGELDLGVGKATLNLLGDPEGYTVEMKKGIGSITFNGKSIDGNRTVGVGDTEVEINGGIGSIIVNTD